MRSHRASGAIAFGASAIAIESIAIADALRVGAASCVSAACTADGLAGVPGALGVVAIVALGVAVVSGAWWLGRVVDSRRTITDDVIARDLLAVRAARARPINDDF